MKPEYIDIHTHTQFSVFDTDRKEVVERALNKGVWVINVGTEQSTSKRAVEIADEFDQGVYAIIGLHPVHANASYHDESEFGSENKNLAECGEVFDKSFYSELAKNKKVVGIGECGLDFSQKLEELEIERQKKAFKDQIELAIELDLPLMLHIRSGEIGNAYREVLDILKSYKIKYGDRLRGDAHFFAGSLEEAKEFLELGFYLSYTGVVTFAKPYIDLVKNTPIDRIMSETDSPYVAPVPERGKRNEPSFVIHIAHRIAEIKGIPVEECKKHIIDNAFKLWRL